MKYSMKQKGFAHALVRAKSVRKKALIVVALIIIVLITLVLRAGVSELRNHLEIWCSTHHDADIAYEEIKHPGHPNWKKNLTCQRNRLGSHYKGYRNACLDPDFVETGIVHIEGEEKYPNRLFCYRSLYPNVFRTKQLKTESKPAFFSGTAYVIQRWGAGSPGHDIFDNMLPSYITIANCSSPARMILAFDNSPGTYWDNRRNNVMLHVWESVFGTPLQRLKSRECYSEIVFVENYNDRPYWYHEEDFKIRPIVQFGLPSLSRLVRAKADCRSLNIRSPSAVFIRRTHRGVPNEQELARFTSSLVTPVFLEKLPSEQHRICYLYNTTVMIGAEGSNLIVGQLYMPRGAAILEILVPRETSMYLPWSWFGYSYRPWQISVAQYLGHSVYRWKSGPKGIAPSRLKMWIQEQQRFRRT